MPKRLFLFRCTYDDTCADESFTEELDELADPNEVRDNRLFTASGKAVVKPNLLYHTAADVLKAGTVDLISYTDIAFDNRTVLSVDQQGFFYDSEYDDLEEVHRAKWKVAKAVIEPYLRYVEVRLRQIAEREEKIINAANSVGGHPYE